MKVNKAYLTMNVYSRPGTRMGGVKGLVVHWVGNPGTSAMANRNYFEGLKSGKLSSKGEKIFASSHYIIGLEGEIVACVPEEEVAYHAERANSYALGIEVCHPDGGGKFGQLTYDTLIELCAELCRKYGLDPITDLVRHYDVTRKDCPSYYVRDTKAWDRLKEDVVQQLGQAVPKQVKIVLNGKVKDVAGIVIEESNYIKLRDLADELIQVGYDETRRLPVLQVKS